MPKLRPLLLAMPGMVSRFGYLRSGIVADDDLNPVAAP